MKTAKILNHNIWIINVLRAHGSLTFNEISRKWQEDKMSDGNALARSSFNRYRDAISDMFGIVIECEPKTYRYYIKNQDVLCDDSIERWLYSTTAVHGMLSESSAVKDRVVLESVATGLEYLQTIISAIKANRRLRLGYQKFGKEGYEKIVSPYALKLFHQRWYMLAKTQENSMRLYALDRIHSLSVMKETFKRLEKTEFYEMRVSVGNNEYRTVLFTIDADNFMECHRMVMLNSFIEKGTKQYKAENWVNV